VKSSQAEWQAKNKKSGTKKKPAGGAAGSGKSTLPATTKWVTPGASKQGAWSSNKPAAKKKTPGASGLFAAMMMNDSDSD